MVNTKGELTVKRLLIWGAGDQGIVTLECALAMNIYETIDFMEIKEKGSRQISGYTILKEEEHDDATLKNYDEVIVATGNNDLREAKIRKLISMEMSLATLIHPTAVISPFARVEKGCTVLANAVININASVGTGCIINTGAIIEHDCTVGEFTNICPKAAMAGHTEIGRKAFLGIGCTIIDNVKVGEEVVVGAGAVVIRDIPDQTVAAGVPARIIKDNRKG